MSVRTHRCPYLHKEKPAHRHEPNPKRDREHNRAAMSRDLRNLVRTSLEA